LPYCPEPPRLAATSDAVVDYQRAVVALGAAPDQDAVVSGAAHHVVLDGQALAVPRGDRGIVHSGDDRAGDDAFDRFERDAVAGGAAHLAVDHAEALGLHDLNQRAAFGQRFAGAIKDETCERDVVGSARNDHRCAADEHEFGCAAHADDLGPRGKVQGADAVFAGTEHQRHPCAGGLIDRRLQHVGLLGAAAGAHAEGGGVDTEGRKRRGGSRRRQTCDRHGAAQRGKNDEAAAVDIHGPAPI